MKLVLPLALGLGALACGDPTGPTTPIDGKQIYDQYCARCHGVDGAGVEEQPAALGRLNNLPLMSSKNDQQIMGVIRAGKPPNMPGFAGEFTEAKLMVLTAYVRSLSLPGVGATPTEAKPAAPE
ncbi:MAG: c-type cytochrome [Nannocystales bacterium]